MKHILYIKGIEGVEAGAFAGVIDNKFVFLKGDDATDRKPLELDEASATAKLAELKTAFPTAEFELAEVKSEPAPVAGN